MPFTYDTTRYATPVSAQPSIKIAGSDLRSFGFELTSLPDVLLPPIAENKIQLDNRNVNLDLGSTYSERRFSISGTLSGLTTEDLVKKIDAFKHWIDQLQHFQTEFIVNQESVRALPLEVTGHVLWYNLGTVAVTNGVATVTGTGTEFTKFVKPGAMFQTRTGTFQFVQQVTNDTSLTLTGNFSGTTDATAEYRIERRRYLLVNYNGESSISSFTDKGFHAQTLVTDGSSYYQQTLASTVVNITIGFYAVNPFWLGDEFVQTETSVAQNTFVALKGVGNTSFLPRIQIVGSGSTVVTPVFVSAKHALIAKLQGTLTHTTTDLTEQDASYTTGTEDYNATLHGLGAVVEAADVLLFDTQLINADKITVLVRFDKNSESSVNKSIIDVFSTTASRTDAFQIRTNGSSNFTVDSRGSSVTTSDYLVATEPAINTNDRIELAFWFDADGVLDEKDGVTYNAKLIINGIIEASTASLPANRPAINLVDVRLGTANALTGIGGNFDMVAIFNQALSDEEIRKVFIDGEYLANKNTKLTLSQSIVAGDISMIDLDQNISFYDSSENVYINDKTNATGQIPIVRGDASEQSILFVTTTTAAIPTLRIVFRPHWT